MKTLARERDTAEVLQRVKALGPTSVRRWGRMSAHQMVCHLCDGCRLLTEQRAIAPVTRPLPPAVMKWIALYLPMRWPSGIQTTPELDQEAGGGTKPVEFAADVARLLELLNSIASAPRASFDGRMHPIFGRMSGRDWLRWAYLHADHHLRQFGV
jgi:hypothetical protein